MKAANWISIAGAGCLGILVSAWIPAGQAQGESLDLDTRLDRIERINRTEHWRTAREAIEELESAVEAEGREDQRIRLARLSAHNLALAGRVDAAMDNLDLYLHRASDATQRLRLLALQANLASVSGQPERAFELLRTALETEDEVNDPTARSELFGVAARMLAEAGETERAHRLGEQAVELAELADSDHPRCLARARLAAALGSNPDLERQEQRLQAALGACTTAGNLIFTGSVLLGLAELNRQQGDLEPAEALIDRARLNFTRAGYAIGINDSRLVEARVDFDRAELDRALDHAHQAAAAFALARRWQRLADTHRLMREIAEQQSDHERALHHAQAGLVARERVIEQDRARRLAHLQIDFELGEMEQALSVLRQQSRVRELEARAREQQRQLELLGHVLAGTLGLVLLILLIHALRERRYYQGRSRRDSLTGLYNHTHFFELAEASLDKAGKNTPVTLIIADIDHFKRINDSHGHQVGDQVLRRTAARFQETFARRGVVGRIGGEEFAVLLPATSPTAAAERVEQLRARLNTGRSDDPPLDITMSFGIAGAGAGETIAELRQRADQMLYRAKRAGRDCFRIDPQVASTEPPPSAARA